MRCLTLADSLKAQGVLCRFISRAHPGNLIELVRERGYEVFSLPARVVQAPAATEIVARSSNRLYGEPTHSAWLGCTWQMDADETGSVLSHSKLDWLIVDHYALDHRWESALAPHYRQLLVIDDLADRHHCSDILLDQNLGRKEQDYADLVDGHCRLLVGPQYALLRPDFAELREYSLQRRRAEPSIRRLLISMGGVDQNNATGQVLQALKGSSLPKNCSITVIMGLTAPWLQSMYELAAEMPWTTEVLVNVKDMAMHMANSDVAIGAAGSSSWERCCLGLPTVMVVLAANQWTGAKALVDAQAVFLIGEEVDIAVRLPLAINALMQGKQLQFMVEASTAVSDGRGVNRLMRLLGEYHD